MNLAEASRLAVHLGSSSERINLLPVSEKYRRSWELPTVPLSSLALSLELDNLSELRQFIRWPPLIQS